MKTLALMIVLLLPSINYAFKNTPLNELPFSYKGCSQEDKNGKVVFRVLYNGLELVKENGDGIILDKDAIIEDKILKVISRDYPDQESHCSSGTAETVQMIKATIHGEEIKIKMNCYQELSPSWGPVPKHDPYYVREEQYCY